MDASDSRDGGKPYFNGTVVVVEFFTGGMSRSAHEIRSERQPAGNVDQALRVVQLHQESIQYADTKIARLAGALGALVTLVASHAPAAYELLASPARAVAFCSAGITFLGAATAVVRHLSLGFQPHTSAPSESNRFGFPEGHPDPVVPAPDSVSERNEAWLLAIALGRIAQRKHRRVRAAIPWIMVGGGAALVWTLAGLVL
ncbi:hypothetical protein [Micromonospora chersina]|uniref:hypothetical protein n=1 Tax=Micromonospora chersina TaxID=47854 RepID=UPI00372212BC